jgi:hypothetical protein
MGDHPQSPITHWWVIVGENKQFDFAWVQDQYFLFCFNVQTRLKNFFSVFKIFDLF